MATPRPLLKGFERIARTTDPDPKKRLTIFDPETRGLCVRITPQGGRTYTVMARDPRGKQVWAAIPDGNADHMPLSEARAVAAEAVRRIKMGETAFPKVEPPPAPETFEAVARNFLERHVKRQALRSGVEINRIFRVYVFPAWGTRPFAEIRRRDVAGLLDKVEDNNGPVMADAVLAAVGKLFSWYQARDDNFVSPVVPGMRRSNPTERARKRILSDDEIRILWPLLDGTYGAFVKVALLTGQRQAKVAAMKWDDIADDGTWTIPTEPREKSNPGTLKLPAAVLAIIRGQPRVKGNPYVFAATGARHICWFQKYKAALDLKVTRANGGVRLERWVIHDLRRTAKSFMARAGVRPDISERVLGHVIGGVEGTYDRHDYETEKADALQRLAALVETITNPPANNVVPMRGAAE